jgi:hypothetical protein
VTKPPERIGRRSASRTPQKRFDGQAPLSVFERRAAAEVDGVLTDRAGIGNFDLAG